jgi:hypothetical protein
MQKAVLIHDQDLNIACVLLMVGLIICSFID